MFVNIFRFKVLARLIFEDIRRIIIFIVIVRKEIM